jgi:hypothetical protein
VFFLIKRLFIKKISSTFVKIILIKMYLIKDIDLINDAEKYDVILVGTNTYCTMSNGFQGKVRRKYHFVYEMNCKTKYGDINKLGTRITTKNTSPIFSLCFISKGYNFIPKLKPEFIDYNALENCIKTANVEFSGLRVATTIMGITEFDGNGDRDKILKILEDNSDRMDLHVYDYIQYNSRIERTKEFNKNHELCAKNPEVSKAIVEKQIEERSKLTTFDEPAYTGKKKLKNYLRDLANN